MKSYLKFLSRNKLYTAIEAVGLSVSLAFVIISFCYVMQQYAVPRENPDRERIYAVGTEDMLNTYAMKDVLEGKIPEIETITRFNIHDDQLIYVGDLCLKGTLLNCDREFFDIFPVTFKEGTAEQINETNTAFISESVAKRMGGEVLGKQLIIGNDTLRIAGIFSSLGSSLFPEIAVIGNMETSSFERSFREENFSYYLNIHIFVKTIEGADREELARKIKDVCEASFPYGWGHQTGMVRLDEHFYSDKNTGLNKGNQLMLRTMIIIGLILLFSSLINYINLNNALVGKRAKEMASRRLLGAQKTEIVGKYFAESFFFTFCCFVIGILIAEAITPLVNQLMSVSVAVKVPYTWNYLLYYLLIVIVVSLLAGLIPAIIISKTQPINVVRGTFRYHSKKVLSKVFIVLQNIIAIALIALVFTMELQMRHLKERPIGVRMENLFFLKSDLDISKEKTAFVDDLRALPCVKEVASAQNVPGIEFFFALSKIHEEENNQYVAILTVDTAAFRMLGIEVREQFKEPSPYNFYMTETTVAWMTGLPYGVHNYDTIETWRKGTIGNECCGVVADFKMQSALLPPANELVIVFVGPWNPYVGLLIETVGDPEDARSDIKALYAKYSNLVYGTYLKPEHCGFINEVVAENYETVRNQMRLIELIMAVSVLLSLLGLVAMSTHFASEREKSIAIRKVFGGTLESETRRSLMEYLILMLIANAIAIPIAIYVCGKYLERFAYRIDLSPWIFILAVVLSLLIAFLSVLWQTLRAAKTNPAEALKKE